MSIRRRTSGTSTISGLVDVDLDHTTDSVTIGDETNKMVLQDVTGTKCIPVKVLSTVGSSGGTSATDSAAYTPTTSTFTPIGGGYDDVSTDNLAEGEMGIVRLTATRKMHTYDSAVEALLTTQAGYLDGIEGLLTTQAGYLDGLETLITSTNTKLDTLGTYMDGLEGFTDNIETLITSTNTKADTQITALQLLDDVVVADNAGFTDGTTKLSMAGFIYDEVAGTALTENDAAAGRINVNRALVSAVEDGATRGRYATVTAANALKVDASGAAVPITDNASSLTVDCTAANAKVDIGLINGVAPLMGAGNTGTGSLRVTLATDQANLTTPMNVNVSQMNGVATTMGNGVAGTGVQRVAIASDNTAFNIIAAGNVAHDSPVSGNPVRMAGRAMLANGTAVAEDDVADIATDNQGRQIVTVHAPRDLITHATTTFTASVAETTILAAGAAGVFHDLTKLIITNSSSSALIVTIKDATAGTTRMIVAVAANGGAVIDFGAVPCCQAAAASNWTATCGTSVSSIYIYAQAVKRIA